MSSRLAGEEEESGLIMPKVPQPLLSGHEGGPGPKDLCNRRGQRGKSGQDHQPAEGSVPLAEGSVPLASRLHVPALTLSRTLVTPSSKSAATRVAGASKSAGGGSNPTAKRLRRRARAVAK